MGIAKIQFKKAIPVSNSKDKIKILLSQHPNINRDRE